MKLHPLYMDNVFINCPFDEEYDPIFEAMVFAVHACGFIARCAKEYEDSDAIRIEMIFKIIYECKYGIHDLSRIDLSGNTLPRFNMPLELGIFMGCKKFGTSMQKEKKYLVLDSEKYRYKQFISDISGQDIHAHGNQPAEAIKSIRNWLAFSSKRKTVPGASFIISQFENFKEELPEICLENRWSEKELIFPEFSGLVTQWLTDSQNGVVRKVPRNKRGKLSKALHAN